MPRQARCEIQTNYFHVMTQGLNKSYIFSNPDEINTYIRFIHQLKSDNNINIIAYCIMNNHSHLLLHVENVNDLSKFMKRLNTKYAMYYNHKYNRVGFVFRNRFRSEGIYSEKQLNACINYIYNNPVKAKICNSPEEYPYSDYNEKVDRFDKISYNEYLFIDLNDNKEILLDDIVNKFLIDNNIVFEKLLDSNSKFRELLIIIRNRKIPWKLIEQKFNMSYTTLYNIIK